MATSRPTSATPPSPARACVLNPSSANGLGSCTPEQIGLASEPGVTPVDFNGAAATCPDAAKLGEVEVVSPLLGEHNPQGEVTGVHPLKGAVYLAKPFANPCQIAARDLRRDRRPRDRHRDQARRPRSTRPPSPVSSPPPLTTTPSSPSKTSTSTSSVAPAPRSRPRQPAAPTPPPPTSPPGPAPKAPTPSPKAALKPPPSSSGSPAPEARPNNRTPPPSPPAPPPPEAGALPPSRWKLRPRRRLPDDPLARHHPAPGLTGKLAGVAECSIRHRRPARANTPAAAPKSSKAPSCPLSSRLGTVTGSAPALAPNPSTPRAPPT